MNDPLSPAPTAPWLHISSLRRCERSVSALTRLLKNVGLYVLQGSFLNGVKSLRCRWRDDLHPRSLHNNYFLFFSCRGLFFRHRVAASPPPPSTVPRAKTPALIFSVAAFPHPRQISVFVRSTRAGSIDFRPANGNAALPPSRFPTHSHVYSA